MEFIMEKKLFGKTAAGDEVYTYTLKNDEAELTVMNYGGVIVRFAPYGTDVVCGYETFEDYMADTSSQGATIGRVANRIEGAEFTMDGAIYMLPANSHGHCLHGGPCFNRRIWKLEGYTDESVTLSYYSPDGECGFPAGLMTKVTFTLSGTALVIGYEAQADGKTPVALTNHSYFNLNGCKGGDILSHKARIYAKTYTAVDERLIPTGEHPETAGGVFDFGELRAIGPFPEGFKGYDHNFVLTPEIYKDFIGTKVGLCATVTNDVLTMNVYTDQPGVQFYTANFLGGNPNFRGGVSKVRHGAFCLEAQTEPNAVKKGECFIEAGELYRQTTVYEVKRA